LWKKSVRKERTALDNRPGGSRYVSQLFLIISFFFCRRERTNIFVKSFLVIKYFWRKNYVILYTHTLHPDTKEVSCACIVFPHCHPCFLGLTMAAASTQPSNWVPDTAANTCQDCKVTFTFFNRRY